MHNPSIQVFLSAWEGAQNRHGSELGAALLRAMGGEGDHDPMDLTIGHRNRRLLELRRRHFGPRLESVVRCETCGGRSEIDLDCDAILASPAPAAETIEIQWQGQSLRFRLPTSRDIAEALVEGGDVSERLAARCRVAGGDVESTPDPELAAVVAREMEEADPMALIQVKSLCDHCGITLRWVLDVGAFLWEEVEIEVQRLFCEVHILARAYGWDEGVILAMSPARRRVYLDLTGA